MDETAKVVRVERERKTSMPQALNTHLENYTCNCSCDKVPWRKPHGALRCKMVRASLLQKVALSKRPEGWAGRSELEKGRRGWVKIARQSDCIQAAGWRLVCSLNRAQVSVVRTLCARGRWCAMRLKGKVGARLSKGLQAIWGFWIYEQWEAIQNAKKNKPTI